MKEDFWLNKRVFLTGHTGFKGVWLILFLQSLGANVCGYSLAAEPLPNLYRSIKNNFKENLLHFEGNILNKQLLKNVIRNFNPEIVFHLAAQPLVRESFVKPNETWETNLIGTLNLLECLKEIKNKCSIVIVTTDKVYENQEWTYGYRENDPLGGHDPYSASKACTEIMVDSWRKSFCGKASHQTSNLNIATARAGNVVGGGDWAKDRLIPDIVKGIIYKEPIKVRNPNSVRPWQHVLEPLRGYIMLAKKLYQEHENSDFQTSFNFGPNSTSNRTVLDLVNEINKNWECNVDFPQTSDRLHESKRLLLNIEKANAELDWYPYLSFEETISRTISWYKEVNEGADPYKRCMNDLNYYMKKTNFD